MGKDSSTSPPPPSTATDLQKALHYAVGSYCSSIEKENIDACKRACKESSPMDDDDAITIPQMTTGAIAALTDLAYAFMTENLAPDLESFSKHANRRTITENDVLLAARKNPNRLLDRLKSLLQEKRADADVEKRNRSINQDLEESKRTWSNYDVDTSSNSSSSGDDSTQNSHPDSRIQNKQTFKTTLLESLQDESSSQESSLPHCQAISSNYKPLSFTKISSKDTKKGNPWAASDDDDDDDDDDNKLQSQGDNNSEDEFISFDTVVEECFYSKRQRLEDQGGNVDDAIDLADDD